MDNQNIHKTNENLIRDYFNKLWNRGELDCISEIIDCNYINHSPGGRNPEPGPSGLKPIIEEIRAGFPDLNYEIEDLIITKDKVVARVTMTATHLGELWGINPSGAKIKVNQINIEKISNGKIVEHWRVTDELLLMKQLGVIS